MKVHKEVVSVKNDQQNADSSATALKEKVFCPEAAQNGYLSEMAEYPQESAPKTRPIGRFRARPYTAERIGEELIPQVSILAKKLPRVISAARGIPEDQCQSIMVASITALITTCKDPIYTSQDLENLLWVYARHRVYRHHEGRNLDAGKKPGHDAFDNDEISHGAGLIATHEAEPASVAERSEEWGYVQEFVFELSPLERQIFYHKYAHANDVQRPLGWRRISKELDLPIGTVRMTERTIDRKLNQFRAVMSAGTMCAHREPLIAGYAQEALLSEENIKLAKAHLSHCRACRRAYQELREQARSREFQRAAAGFIGPLPFIVKAKTGLLGKLLVALGFRKTAGSTATGATATATGGAAISIKTTLLISAVVATTTVATHQSVPKPLKSQSLFAEKQQRTTDGEIVQEAQFPTLTNVVMIAKLQREERVRRIRRQKRIQRLHRKRRLQKLRQRAQATAAPAAVVQNNSATPVQPAPSQPAQPSGGGGGKGGGGGGGDLDYLDIN